MSLIELIMARDLTRYFFHIVYHVIVTVIENIFRLFGNIEIQCLTDAMGFTLFSIILSTSVLKTYL